MARVNFTYFSGRTKPMDSRFAKTLEKLNKGFIDGEYNKKVITRSPAVKSDELTSVREEYHKKFDKKPFHGWTVEQLREKLEGKE